MKRLPRISQRVMRELAETAAEWRAARAYALANPEIMSRLEDATVRALCEALPSGGDA